MISYSLRSFIFTLARSLFIFFFIVTIASFPLISVDGSNIQDAKINNNDENSLSKKEKLDDELIQNVRFSNIHPSLSNSATIQHIPDDTKIIMASYLDDPVTTLGSIDMSYFDLFHKKYNLKYYLNERFDIPELCDVDENEPEIAGILSFLGPEMIHFVSLVLCLKTLAAERNLIILFRPLISYIRRLYHELGSKSKQNFDSYLMNRYVAQFPIHLGNICANNGHFDLAFEFLNEWPGFLIRALESIGNRKDLMDFFKEYPHLAMQYSSHLINAELIGFPFAEFHHLKNVFKWIGECIIYDAPEEFYAELLAFRPIILVNLIKCDWFLTLNVSESDYPSIYAKIRKLLDVYSSPKISSNNFSDLVNDIRFGSIGLSQLKIEIPMFNEKQLVMISKAAFFGNKFDIFHEIIVHYDTKIIDAIIKLMQDIDLNLQETCFKAVFEVIAASPERFGSEKYLKFIMKFYALYHLKIEDDKICFEFVAPSDSSLPSSIIIGAHFSDIFTFCFVNKMFSYMKVVNEESFSSLLSDYAKCSGLGRSLPASIEVIELLAKTPNLIKNAEEFGLNFLFSITNFQNLKNYLNLPNFEKTSFMVEPFHFYVRKTIELKTRNHLKKIEKLQKRTADDFYLECEFSEIRKFTECHYFEWRLVLSHWIKGDKKTRIREIKSPVIIKMLRLEFPDEMRELLPENNLKTAH